MKPYRFEQLTIGWNVYRRRDNLLIGKVVQHHAMGMSMGWWAYSTRVRREWRKTEVRGGRVANGSGVAATAGITLDESQRQALAIIRRSAIAVLTGGPGTGKTTITKQVVSEALANGRRIAAMARPPASRIPCQAGAIPHGEGVLVSRTRPPRCGIEYSLCHHHPQRHGSHPARRRRARDAAGPSRHAAGR